MVSAGHSHVCFGHPWFVHAHASSIFSAVTAKPPQGNKHKIENVYLQDPVFNHLDIELLQSLGYTVLETPSAFQQMTTNTFLFDPHVDWKLTARAVSVADPCLRIGNMILDDVSM